MQRPCKEGITREERPTTAIPSPSHILLIFSSEPPRNPRPCKKKIEVSYPRGQEYFLKICQRWV